MLSAINNGLKELGCSRGNAGFMNRKLRQNSICAKPKGIASRNLSSTTLDHSNEFAGTA